METRKPVVLIVDDEEPTRRILKLNLQDRYQVLLARNGEEALQQLSQTPVDVLVTDMRMPGLSGLDLLKQVHERWPDLPVIVVTAYGTIENAVEAMRQGAYDYLQKPIKIAELEVLLEKTLRYRRTLDENVKLRAELRRVRGIENILTADPKMQALLSQLQRVAPTKATVLIEGESGTGKELFARALHALSDRADGPFVDVNCGAIPHELLESELFGHEKGAFTGAVSTRKGKFELADGGTLFLDEIGELEKELQVKLLRAIEEERFTRVGGTEPISVDIRLVAATNRDLQAEVRAGRFRQDLYYRLNVVRFRIPPLRERLEDIPLLVRHFLKKHEATAHHHVEEVDPEVLEILARHPWPGNVRELENAILRAMLLDRDGRLTVEDLPEEIREGVDTTSVGSLLTKDDLQRERERQWQKLSERLERQFLEAGLRRTGGNISELSRQTGYSRRQLQNLLRKHNLNPENFTDL